MIREDFRANDASLTRPGFQALAVHRFGNAVLGLPRVLRAPLSVLHDVCHVFVRNVYGIELPRSTRVGRRVRISHQSGIVIHPEAVIGDDCTIRQNVTIGAVSRARAGHAPVLGAGVEVGAGAVIIGRVRVGDGAHVGPNTVVMTSIPAGATVVAAAPRVLQPPAPRQAQPPRESAGPEIRAIPA
ncbi:MAG: serine acetyltransferase [Gemmatimonadota bacterium]